MKPIYLILLFTLVTPFLVLHFMKLKQSQHILQASVIAVLGSLIVFATILFMQHSKTKDVEVWNGFVIGKDIHRFSCPVNTSNPCRNGYSCNCVVIRYECGTSKAPMTCFRTECDTCYVYPWEQDFYVHSSIDGKNAYQINRVDRQGAVTPPRWHVVKVGDPVSVTKAYTNYILGSIESIFAEDGVAEAKYKDRIPAYPIKLYDYYKIDRVVTVGHVKIDKRVWNESLSRILVEVGPKKQANIVLVLAEGVGIDYANAVRRAWRGFKKNDIVVFVGLNKDGKVTWTRVMSWSKADIVNVKIESNILQEFSGRPLQVESFMNIVKRAALAHFVRRPMEEFEYLKGEFSLSSGEVWGVIIISLLVSILQAAFIKVSNRKGLTGNSYYHTIYNREQVEKFFNERGKRKMSKFKI